MKNSALYHTLPTIRKVRRLYRRTCQKVNKEFGSCFRRSTLILRDSDNANILKTRRWRNRFMTTNSF